jgi:hypothetical protein
MSQDRSALFRSPLLRGVLVLTAALFALLMLGDWAEQDPRMHAETMLLVAPVIALGLGAAFPRRLWWALRFFTGLLGVTYAFWFGAALLGMLRGEPQVLTLGEPSALGTGIGFVVIGVPLLVHAITGAFPWDHWRRMAAERAARLAGIDADHANPPDAGSVSPPDARRARPPR